MVSMGMDTTKLLLVSVAALSLGGGSAIPANAGTFKRILIDGEFADWAGVPPAMVDDEDAAGSFDFKEVFVANDETYLYVRATLHAPANTATFHHQIMIDADQNPGTGFPWVGVGSEMFVEDGSGYQQKNGGFNEGSASGLDWQSAPTGQIHQFEARIARGVLDAEGVAVFQQTLIALGVQVLDLNWATKDAVNGITYEFAEKPLPATGSHPLVGLTTSSWAFEDSGTDLGVDWREPSFDDVLAGWTTGPGLLGFGAGAGVYPAPVQTALTPGRTTYYFRTAFDWPYDNTGMALVVTNVLSDGAVYYLNGARVKSVRMPDGEAAYGTPATGGPASAGRADVFSLPASALVTGVNVLAIEAHQATATPGELVFGLSLTATDSAAPVIENPALPADRSIAEGDPTTFDVGTVLGSPPLTYQWLKDGQPLAGATSPILTLPVVLFEDRGSYALEITNAQGQKTTSRAAALTTTASPVAFTDPMLPADVAVYQGEDAQFSVSVSGSPVVTYQWYRNGALLDGAINANLALTDVAETHAGVYTVTVSNRLGAVTSRAATLTVLQDKSGPTLAEVTGSASSIVVVFSEPVDNASASVKDRYSVSGGVTVLAATVDAGNPNLVRLSTTPQAFGSTHVLTASGVLDRFGNSTSSSLAFRSAILIDGNFDDWAGIAAAGSEPQDTAAGLEWKDFYVTNDAEYLYLRFTFHAPVGPLPVNHYYHVNIDADGDAATGRAVAGIGVEVMVENGGAYQQKGGGFNEGVVNGLDFALAPETATQEFECRISRRATYDSDGTAVFQASDIALAFELISSAWSLVDLAPAVGGVRYTFVEWPALNPGPLRIRSAAGSVEISWDGGGTLESRESVATGNWTAVPNATSPYRTSPSATGRFYRLRQ